MVSKAGAAMHRLNGVPGQPENECESHTNEILFLSISLGTEKDSLLARWEYSKERASAPHCEVFFTAAKNK